eukprot:12331393-Heterocapsa_arctica.AAC.1
MFSRSMQSPRSMILISTAWRRVPRGHGHATVGITVRAMVAGLGLGAHESAARYGFALNAWMSK